MVLGRTAEDLVALLSDERWQPLRPDRVVGVWTDDFSNVLSILR